MSKYIGTVTIVDGRLMGRFNSNITFTLKPSKYRWIAILKTKVYAMYQDYFVQPSNKGIYFKITREIGDN